MATTKSCLGALGAISPLSVEEASERYARRPCVGWYLTTTQKFVGIVAGFSGRLRDEEYPLPSPFLLFIYTTGLGLNMHTLEAKSFYMTL